MSSVEDDEDDDEDLALLSDKELYRGAVALLVELIPMLTDAIQIEKYGQALARYERQLEML